MKRLNESKKAQIEVTFNWFYVLIAGGVILLFFAGIIVKQQVSAEKDLSTDLVRIMESIFTGAGVSEQTKNLDINLGGLADYTLYFDCEKLQGKGGLGVYGIKDMESKVENNIDPLFAPLELKTPRLMLWSLPYKLPFKVQDFLFVTSPNIQFFVIGDDPFKTELLKSTLELNNFKEIMDFSEISAGKDLQIRIVDLDGQAVKANDLLPDNFDNLNPNLITAVSFKLLNQAEYFKVQSGRWISSGKVNLISLRGDEKPAAKYGAIFAGSPEVYECNMQKALQRLSQLNKIYAGEEIQFNRPGGKLKQMIDFYENHPNPAFRQSKGDCLGYLKTDQDNLNLALFLHSNNALSCLESDSINNLCVSLSDSAQKIQSLNNQLKVDGNCLTLY